MRDLSAVFFVVFESAMNGLSQLSTDPEAAHVA
jgi:hypothetical protein